MQSTLSYRFSFEGGEMSDHLISAYGGDLVDLLVDDKRSSELKAQSREWLSWDLTQRQICDLGCC